MSKPKRKLIFDGNFDASYESVLDEDDTVISVHPDKNKLSLDLSGSKSFSGFEDVKVAPVADFDFTAQVKVFSNKVGAIAGIFFRKTGKGNYYLFAICEDYDGCYAVFDGYSMLLEWKYADVSATRGNELRVVARGRKLEFYINSKLVHSVTNASRIEAGRLGFVAANESSGQTTKAMFNNVRLYKFD